MAKSALSADQLESLLSTVIAKTLPEVLLRVLDKFEQCLEKLADKFEARLSGLESKISEMEKQREISPSLEPTRAASPPSVDQSLQMLMAIETEKMERTKRQFNVIISGFPSDPDQSDEVNFIKFCEENLTVKPVPVLCRRVGRQVGNRPRKLKVTLEHEHDVTDLIESSQLLRQSSIHHDVYFNRDLTPLEAQLAFEARQARNRDNPRRQHALAGNAASS